MNLLREINNRIVFYIDTVFFKNLSMPDEKEIIVRLVTNVSDKR